MENDNIKTGLDIALEKIAEIKAQDVPISRLPQGFTAASAPAVFAQRDLAAWLQVMQNEYACATCQGNRAEQLGKYYVAVTCTEVYDPSGAEFAEVKTEAERLCDHNSTYTSKAGQFYRQMLYALGTLTGGGYPGKTGIVQRDALVGTWAKTYAARFGYEKIRPRETWAEVSGMVRAARVRSFAIGGTEYYAIAARRGEPGL